MSECVPIGAGQKEGVLHNGQAFCPLDTRELNVCPQCGRTMTTVGHEVCEILEVEPAWLRVLQRKDEPVACGEVA